MRRQVIIAGLCILPFAGALFTRASREQLPQKIEFRVPEGWPAPVYDLAANPLTTEGFELGRKLFYDGRLSQDGNFSCASCHQQFAAFSTYDHALSHGFNNSFTIRNAPGLFNLAWKKEFMWDGGVNHLDLQPLAPIEATNEMAENIDHVLRKLRQDSLYPSMFKQAFGSKLINTQRMTKALSQFLLLMVSSNSKYDRVKAGLDNFNLPERLGYAIFQQKCISCHREPLFTDESFRNTGLQADPYINDKGRMQITHQLGDSLRFKVPSLRNVMVTAPYGHDGRFYSVLDVLENYRKKGPRPEGTDSLLRNGIPLSNFEIGQLRAFLYTLTDSSFLKDLRFADPELVKRITPFNYQHLH